MQRTAKWISLIALVALLLPATVSLAKEKPYEEKTGRRGWHLFLWPAKKNPQDQLVYAVSLQQAGETKSAMRQYLALVTYWPESTEAATAQYRYAQLVDGQDKYQDAFDEYQRLFERYPGQFPYDDVLDRQFAIANHLMNTRKGKVLFLPGFFAPERAIPLFQAIMTNAPQWEKSAEVQFLIGRANELSLDYENAIDAYMTAQQRYPTSPFAEKAAYGSAHCFYLLADETPNNQQILESAWASVTLFLQDHPKSANADEVTQWRSAILRMRAKLAYEKASYYDRIVKKPKAALIMYEAMLREFPHSEWTDEAKARIQALSQYGEIDKDEKTTD